MLDKIVTSMGFIFLIIGIIVALWFCYNLLCEPIILIGVLLFIIFIISLKMSDVKLWEEQYKPVRDKLKDIFYNFTILIITFLIVAVCFIAFWGNEDINSIFCKDEVKFKGYVYAFPDGTKDKNYLLQADMHKIGSSYNVDKIYFYNGGYIEFEECEGSNKKGELFYCTPIEDERNWGFRFYGDIVKSPKVKK